MKQLAKITIVAVVVLMAGVVTGCRTDRKAAGTVATASFATYALTDGYDGTITLKVWGNGADRDEAIDHALKRALNDVLFKGITTGPGLGGQPMRPMIDQVNARDRYAYFFNPFFSAGGAYKKFASENTENRSSRVKADAQGRQADGIVVVVDLAGLKAYLTNAGILQQ